MAKTKANKVTKMRVEYYEEVIPTTLKEFETWEFTNGSTTGDDFNIFAGKFMLHIRKSLPEGVKLVNFNRGHYYCSGFVQYEDKFAYFSISDVRHFPGDWVSNILIRTAESVKDYTGGRNGFCTLEQVGYYLGRLVGVGQRQKRLV